MSSAYNNMLIFESPIDTPTSSSLITGMRSLMYRVKSVGAKLSTCRTPLSTGNESVMTLLIRTLERRSLYIFLMVKYIFPRIPLHSSLYMRSVWFTLSNALAQSTKQANVDSPAEVIAGLTPCQVGRVRFVTHGNCCCKSSAPPPTVCNVPPG